MENRALLKRHDLAEMLERIGLVRRLERDVNNRLAVESLIGNSLGGRRDGNRGDDNNGENAATDGAQIGKRTRRVLRIRCYHRVV